MGAVTLTSDWAPADGPLTVADLERTPADGRRYELVDGVLIVSPAPAVTHQLVMLSLAVELRAVCPPDLEVVPGPGLRMSGTTELIPDLVVERRADLMDIRLTEPPVLVVEVRSRSTAVFDMNTKKAVYERFGIELYWIVVPDRERPALLAFELRDGKYEEVAHVVGEEEFLARRPFPVTVIPAKLMARLPR
jgi:Uma2 family endonuclease